MGSLAAGWVFKWQELSGIFLWLCLFSQWNKKKSHYLCMGVLSVELGFFHRMARNAFCGFMHRKMWGVGVRFIRAKTKDCPQVSDVWSTIRWRSSLSLRKSTLWSLRPTGAPARPRRVKTQRCRTSCVSHPHPFLHCPGCMGPRPWPGFAWACATASLLGCDTESTPRSPGPWLSFDYISSGLGMGKVPLKLTSFLSNCVRPYLHGSFSQLLEGLF